jgi:hypothetical protein
LLMQLLFSYLNSKGHFWVAGVVPQQLRSFVGRLRGRS